MKSKKAKKRKANRIAQARTPEHQQAVLGLRSSSAASPHGHRLPRSVEERRAIKEQGE